MEVRDCILGRRSVRQFTNEPISNEIIQELIADTIFAPSACNFQAWKFVYATDADLLSKYVEGGANALLKKAPGCLVVAYRNDIYVSGHAQFDYIQSASAAIQNFLLLAYDKGIGTCWVCDLPDQKVSRAVFGIPENFDVIACVLCGYPLVGSESNTREKVYHYGTEHAYDLHARKYNVEQVLSFNRFEVAQNDCSQRQYHGKAGYLLKRNNRRLKSGLKSVLPAGVVKLIKKWKHELTGKNVD